LNAIKQDGSREDREMLGREVEKAEAERRGVRGDEPGGTIVEGIEDGEYQEENPHERYVSQSTRRLNSKTILLPVSR
jgi:hypothetical protein